MRQSLRAGNVGGPAFGIEPVNSIAIGADDEIAVLVFTSAGDAREFLLPRVGAKIALEMAGGPFLDAAIGEAPKAVVPAGEQEIHVGDGIGADFFGRVGYLTFGGVNREQAVGRADPDRAGAFGDDGAAVVEIIRADIGAVNGAVGMAGELAVLRAKPDGVGGILAGLRDGRLAEAGGDFLAGNAAIADEGDAGVHGAEPEIVLTVFKKINNAVVIQTGGVVLIKGGEANAVEPHEAVECAEPEMVVVRAGHGGDDAALKS